MGLLKVQRLVLVGTILGDAYLQPTGKRNARLRLEHSLNQKDYIFWKYQIFKNYMQSEPELIKRYNPHGKKTYVYWRCQSHSSPIFGKYRRLFYREGKKVIPLNIKKFLKSPLTLAVWIMDDGYLYKRDQHLFIYLPDYQKEEIRLLQEGVEANFEVRTGYKEKKLKKEKFLWFDRVNTRKIINTIKPHLLFSMKKKFLLTP